MVNQQVVEYVQRYLSQGYSPQQIQQVLLRNGYSPQQIQGVFFEINHRNAPHPKRKFTMIVAVIMLIIIISAVALWFAFQDNNPKPNITTTTTTYTTTTTSSYSSTTTTILYTQLPEQENLELFESLLCYDIDEKFNCFENKEREFEKGSSVFIYFKLFLDAKYISRGYRVGFTEDREVIGPDGNRIDVLSYDNVMDVSKSVTEAGTWKIPVFNEIVTFDSDLPGKYIVKITIKDKYSESIVDFETEFMLK